MAKKFVRCIYNSGYEYTLKAGELYELVEEQEGIFPSCPYYIVKLPDGRRVAAHKGRFEESE